MSLEQDMKTLAETRPDTSQEGEIYDRRTLTYANSFDDRWTSTAIRAIEWLTGKITILRMVKKFEKTYKQQKHMFPEDPMDVFRRQVWVSPYYEDDLVDLKDEIGADHMLFGSDWPHAEGLPEPTDFIHDLHEFNSDEIEKIMRTNGIALTQRAV